jgi:hypothetical protein
MSGSDISYNISMSSWAFLHNSLRLRHSVCEQFMKESLSTLKIVWRVHIYHWKLTGNWGMNQNVELYICTFFNYSQNNWASLLLMTELVINNHDFISTEVSLFVSWVSHEVSTTTWEVEACTICKSSVNRKLIKLYKRWKKSQSEHRWLWSVTQQIQKEDELKRQQSYDQERRQDLTKS